MLRTRGTVEGSQRAKEYTSVETFVTNRRDPDLTLSLDEVWSGPRRQMASWW